MWNCWAFHSRIILLSSRNQTSKSDVFDYSSMAVDSTATKQNHVFKDRFKNTQLFHPFFMHWSRSTLMHIVFHNKAGQISQKFCHNIIVWALHSHFSDLQQQCEIFKLASICNINDCLANKQSSIKHKKGGCSNSSNAKTDQFVVHMMDWCCYNISFWWLH